jgi:ferritin-like protein
MAAEGFHESSQELTPYTRDMHRAIRSLMEELEAVDWYQQRVDAAHDAALKEILAHNRDEEKEHAAMVLEWIRRQDPVFDEQLRRYLFTAEPIVHQEESTREAGKAAAAAIPAIGSLKRTAAHEKGGQK